MAVSFRERLQCMKVEEALVDFPALRLAPGHNGSLRLVGELEFRVQGPEGEPVEDAFAVELSFPEGFPRDLAPAWETGGRIPVNFHKMGDGSLCLGAPTAQRVELSTSPTVPCFIRKLLIPYLFGFSFYALHGKMPYDELAHGDEGICQYIASLFGAPCTSRAKDFLRLASLKKRSANKRPCPCGSGQRLGRCHNRSVNNLRDRFGRAWFQEEFARVAGIG